jgi:hypothetical protein
VGESVRGPPLEIRRREKQGFATLVNYVPKACNVLYIFRYPEIFRDSVYVNTLRAGYAGEKGAGFKFGAQKRSETG